VLNLCEFTAGDAVETLENREQIAPLAAGASPLDTISEPSSIRLNLEELGV
jgi:hypothetical protein